MLSRDRQAVSIAWIGWAALFLVVAAMIIAGINRSAVVSDWIAALNWLAGRGLYDGTGVGGFVYFPQAAILSAPFALLPHTMGEVLWRFVNIGVFALGISGLARLADGRTGAGLFPLMTAVALPLAWDCARNGQANLIMAGLMLLSLVDIARERWWRATLWLSLGLAVKPLAIVLVLLAMSIYRPMTWRLLLGMLAVALFPFATQHPAYVVEQYAAFWASVTKAAHVGATNHGWTSPFHALRLAGVDLPERVQTALRLVAACATLVLSWTARRRRDAASSAVFLYSLTAAYVILFSPRTENNTYAILGPAIGVFLARAFVMEKRLKDGILLGGIALAMIGSRLFEHLLTPHAETSWMLPLLATCFSAFLIVRLFAYAAQQPGGAIPGTSGS